MTPAQLRFAEASAIATRSLTDQQLNNLAYTLEATVTVAEMDLAELRHFPEANRAPERPTPQDRRLLRRMKIRW